MPPAPVVAPEQPAPEQLAMVARPSVPPDRVIDEEMAFGDSLRRVEFEQLDADEPEKKVDAAADPPVDPDDPDAPVVADRPVSGGTARIYLQRGFIDDAIADLLRLDPFGGAGGKRIFNVTDSTHRRLEFTLTGEVRRASGRKATALDFIEIWSRFLASRPAQGLALFRNVQGAEEFVSGRAPLVNGFNAADENTIRIRLSRPDPLAFHRMNSPKLVGGPFMLGAYFTAGTKGAETRLLPNKNTQSDITYLEEIIVETGGFPDPMLKSFFNGEYSAVVLHGFPDISELVARESENRAVIHKLPSDRYFLACRPAVDEQARRFVRNNVNGADMLKTALGAGMEYIEGEGINSVSASGEAAYVPRGQVSAPQLPKPFRIIYRADDPISKAVAEKISSDLNRAGMKTEAAGSNAEAYEKTLVNGRYDCAVGWVTEAVLENQAEKLHLASMWFQDETDPQVRLREYREIPLFSVNNYLLLREDTKLYGDRLSGMWTNSIGSADVDAEEE